MPKKLLLAGLITLLGGGLAASQEDAMTSLSYISYLERYATLQPAHEAGPQEAVTNMPIVPGDRLDTAREARLEVVLSDGSLVWVDEYTTVSFDAVAHSRDTLGDRTVLFLAEGSLMVEVLDDGGERRPTRVDGPDATLYLTTAGLYRVDRMPAGGLRVEAWKGIAEASTTGGGVLVRAESAAQVHGGDVTGVEPHLTWGDEFARWVEMRRRPATGDSLRYVDSRHQRQAAMLDSYGSWIWVDDIGSWAWRPDMPSDWRPYTAGRWYWTPVGWSWVSYEPWGWMPYHYGSWHHSAGLGWVWSYHSSWSPAWVHWVYWPGHVGWCPVGYYDWWYWGHYRDYWYDHPRHGGRPPHGGGSPAPPRGNVVPPPRHATSRLAVDDGGPAGRTPPARVALDMEGRVQLQDMEHRAWNVVAAGDFASPHVARLVRPGDEAMRGVDEVGVVRSGALRTAPPVSSRPAELLDQTFRAVDPATSADLTGVLARRTDLSEETARRVRPSSVADLATRGTAPVQRGGVAPAPRVSTGTTAPSAGDGPRVTLPAAPVRAPQASATDGDRVLSNPFRSRVERQPVVPRTSAPDAGRPTLSPPSVLAPRSPASSGGVSSRPVLTPPSASGSGSRPVIVPRTPTLRSRPATAPRSSGGGASYSPPSRSPSSSPSARAPRSSSGRSSAAPAPRSSGGSRPAVPSGSSGRASSSGRDSKG